MIFDFIFEVSKSIGQAAKPGAHSVYAAIDTRIRERGVREVPDGFWIQSAVIELAGPIEVLNRAPEDLHVLLRHRPRSIAPGVSAPERIRGVYRVTVPRKVSSKSPSTPFSNVTDISPSPSTPS